VFLVYYSDDNFKQSKHDQTGSNPITVSSSIALDHNTVKLGYNDHGHNELTAVTITFFWYFCSQMATLLHKSSQL